MEYSNTYIYTLSNFNFVKEMIVLPVYVTEKQKAFLFERKLRTGVNASVQVREAIDDFMEKHGDVK